MRLNWKRKEKVLLFEPSDSDVSADVLSSVTSAARNDNYTGYCHLPPVSSCLATVVRGGVSHCLMKTLFQIKYTALWMRGKMTKFKFLYTEGFHTGTKHKYSELIVWRFWAPKHTYETDILIMGSAREMASESQSENRQHAGQTTLPAFKTIRTHS